MENSENEIQKSTSKGKIFVSNVYLGKFQKEGEALTAELKQIVTTHSIYPAKAVSSDLQDSIFPREDFGFAGRREYENQNVRVTWVPVPVGATIESVTAKLEAIPDATLYRILSNKPIIASNQQAAIEQQMTSVDIIGNGQVVRYPKNHETMAGKLILDAYGKPQYRSVFFSSTLKEDIDLRTTSVSDFYATPEVLEELTNTTRVTQEIL